MSFLLSLRHKTTNAAVIYLFRKTCIGHTLGLGSWPLIE
ncbi:hypothetical protein EV639_1168 [Rathayibacter tanaceti]|uniref:Uncharacterized protein n=2 Tax=Rathayibacter tanaceti TaxID=1671680 RepID=A0ACD2XG85_9MICO|nr:hypothetical protein ACH61_02359 [Rathayibacter tanaceti]TCO32953.1 hypothetical protein EV639_1168 [Rathayibacter tanaceti]